MENQNTIPSNHLELGATKIDLLFRGLMVAGIIMLSFKMYKNITSEPIRINTPIVIDPMYEIMDDFKRSSPLDSDFIVKLK